MAAPEPATDHGPQLPLLPPVLPLGTLALAIVLDWIGLAFLAAPVTVNIQTIVGALLVVAGLGLGGSAALRFRKAGTNVDPRQPALTVVTDGPYRFTRNPMYLGFLLCLVGVSLLLSLEWGLILTPVVWLALDRLIVAREESYLAAKFGAPYRSLLQHTRRWL